MGQDFNTKSTELPNYWPFNADRLPIIAFDPVPRVLVVMLSKVNSSNEHIFQRKVNQVFELVKEIGCDTSIYVGNKGQFKLPIKSSTELHLNFIPRLNLTLDEESQKYYDWRIKQWNDIISECVNNGDIVGWEVCDEPTYNNWGAFNGFTYDAKVFWQQLPIVNAMAKSLGYI